MIYTTAKRTAGSVGGHHGDAASRAPWRHRSIDPRTPLRLSLPPHYRRSPQPPSPPPSPASVLLSRRWCLTSLFSSTFSVLLFLSQSPLFPMLSVCVCTCTCVCLYLRLSPCGPLLLTNYGFLHILFLSRALFREIPAGIKRTSSSLERGTLHLSLFLSPKLCFLGWTSNFN